MITAAFSSVMAALGAAFSVGLQSTPPIPTQSVAMPKSESIQLINVMQEQRLALDKIHLAINELNPNNPLMIVGKPLSVSGLIPPKELIDSNLESLLDQLVIKFEDEHQRPFLIRFKRNSLDNNKIDMMIGEYNDIRDFKIDTNK